MSNSAMREALISAKSNFDAIGKAALSGELNDDAISLVCAKMSAKIEAALSAPMLFKMGSDAIRSGGGGMTIRDAIVITRMEAKGSDGWVREALEICARVASEASKQTKIGRSSRGLTTKKKRK